MEVWKSIPDYEGLYEVSSLGNVRSLDRMVSTKIRHSEKRIARGRVLKQALKKTGYYCVDLCNDGKVKTVQVHRLVALAFIENPMNLRCVNHISGIKTDNRLINLEWLSVKDNWKHAEKMGLTTNVGQYLNKKLLCLETGIIFKNSVKAAEWILTNDPSKTQTTDKNKLARNIRGCATGRTPKAYGYRWKDI